MGEGICHTEGQGWDLVPIPKIILAEQLFRAYYRDHRPGHLTRKELTVSLIQEILRYEAHDLSVGIIRFCLSQWGVVDWDFVAFPKRPKDATTIEVHKRTLEACKGMPSVSFNAEFIALLMELHEDVLIDECLGEDFA